MAFSSLLIDIVVLALSSWQNTQTAGATNLRARLPSFLQDSSSAHPQILFFSFLPSFLPSSKSQCSTHSRLLLIAELLFHFHLVPSSSLQCHTRSCLYTAASAPRSLILVMSRTCSPTLPAKDIFRITTKSRSALVTTRLQGIPLNPTTIGTSSGMSKLSCQTACI